MKLFRLLFAGALVTSAFAASPVAEVAPAKAAAPQITDVVMESYNGWEDCLIMRGGDCRAVIAPAVGGRVMSYTVNGENILLENTNTWGRTLANTPGGFWAGGYQCDVGPEVRGISDHPLLWIGRWGWRVPRPFTVHTFSEPEPALGVQLEKELVIDPDTGDLGVTQRMRNISSNNVSFCLWDRTLCKGGGFALFPLNKKSRFKAGWSIRQGKAGAYRYEGSKPADARVRLMEGVLVARAAGLPEAGELKIGADSDTGWIAYARGKVLFVKYFPVYPGQNYSDDGNTVEFYCSDRVAELEPLSPEVGLKPGGTYSFPGKWTLYDLADEVTTHEKARALVKMIPKSPFAK